jgi:hypothetical protein
VGAPPLATYWRRVGSAWRWGRFYTIDKIAAKNSVN